MLRFMEMFTSSDGTSIFNPPPDFFSIFHTSLSEFKHLTERFLYSFVLKSDLDNISSPEFVVFSGFIYCPGFGYK